MNITFLCISINIVIDYLLMKTVNDKDEKNIKKDENIACIGEQHMLI
jgi:hypothetical protein